MGYKMSKLESRVVSGDEAAALEIIKTLPEKLQRGENPAKSQGFRFEYNTLLHLAALRGMPNLLRVLLENLHGYPHWLNSNIETCLPVACPQSKANETDYLERRKACVKFSLGWRGRMISGQEENLNLSARNNMDDTALHLAAADGLIYSIEELIKAGISPFAGDSENNTPDDGLAKMLGYYCTAFMLDKIMTFDKEVQDEERSNLRMREDDEACFSFDCKMIFNLINENLQDMLILQAIDEVLEKNNSGKMSLIKERYRERLTIKWTTDLIRCFKLAGISISRPGAAVPNFMTGGAPATNRYVICPICVSMVKANARPCIRMKCGHNFCFSCWETYLKRKIDFECQISIPCPIYSCKIVVPNHIVEGLVTLDLVRKYRSLKLMTLINSGSFIKWCPVSNCGLAVRLSVPKYWQKVYEPLEKMGLMPSRAVECGNGHLFCWECLDSCHAPMPCDQWQVWLKRTREHDPGSISKKIKKCAEAINHLWIAEKSKVCPMCSAPAQENDGCKYMTCTQCEYIFRYVCLGACEIRPTLTGGLVECVTPNVNHSSPRGGNINFIRREEDSDINGFRGWSGYELDSDVDEASGSGYISSFGHEDGSDVDEELRSGYIGWTRHEENSDLNEALRSGYIRCTRHGECSVVDEVLRDEHMSLSGHSESSDSSDRERGKYILILHKEFSDVEEILKGYYIFNRNDDGYEMIDKVRDKYFKCSRNEEFYDVDEADEKLWEEAIMRTQERRMLKTFNRYYLKYMDMLKQLQREKYYLKVICDRVECIKKELALRKVSPEKGKEKAQFLIDGMQELLRLRETLASSYAYGFYLDEMGFNTETLCRQQIELEELIKKLMDMIVIPQNRKDDIPSRADVINLILDSRRSRYRYVRVVINSLYKQDLFFFLRKEKRKLPNSIFGYEYEDDMEANHYSVVSSAGAEKQSDTKKRGNTFNCSWLDFPVDLEYKPDETLSDSGIGPCKERGCKRPKVRNPERQKGNYYCPKCMPNGTQQRGLYLRPWRSVEIREKISHSPAEGMEKRNASCMSSATHTPKDVNENGATALSMQQQKTDVGVTIGNVIQEADVEKSAHHTKTNGDLKDERVLLISFENDFQGVTKIAEDTFSQETEVILGEEVDSFKLNQSEDELCTNPGGLEASLSIENSKEHIAGDPDTNTHLIFDFEEKEETTESPPKPIEKPGGSTF